MKQKSNLGRPKLQKGAALNRFIAFRASDAEFKAMESKAKAAGKSVSGWIRGRLMAQPPTG